MCHFSRLNFLDVISGNALLITSVSDVYLQSKSPMQDYCLSKKERSWFCSAFKIANRITKCVLAASSRGSDFFHLRFIAVTVVKYVKSCKMYNREVGAHSMNTFLHSSNLMHAKLSKIFLKF